jgi:hypothetical protein
MTTVTPQEPSQGYLARRWVGSFLAFFLIFGAWALAAPYDGPADEVQHAIRAVGVVSGELMPTPAVVIDGQGNPGMGAYQNVPQGLWNHAWCWGFAPQESAACAPELSGGPITAVPSSAGRYNPFYYALVGWPLKLAPNWLGLVASRLVSAALSAALLACAFTILCRWSRHGLMLAGLLAATTPMLAHLAGAINPNGLEIAAGIALFAAGIPLLLGPVRGAVAPLIALIGVSAALLVTLRSLGPVWLFFGLAALLIPGVRTSVSRLWRMPGARAWTIVVAAAGALSLLWIVVMRTGGVVTPPENLHDYSLSQAAMVYINNWGSYLSGMVGVAGWFDVSMPSPFYWTWISAAASLVILALIAGQRRDRWRALIIFIGGVVVPGILQVSQANTVGFIIGGRYMLPVLVGLPLLGAFALEQHLLDGRRSRSMLKLFILLLLPAHLVLLTYSMVRWQQGTQGSHLNPFTGSWLPPSGPYLPVLLMLAGLVTLGWVSLRGQADTETVPDPAGDSFPSVGEDRHGSMAPSEARAGQEVGTLSSAAPDGTGSGQPPQPGRLPAHLGTSARPT